VLRYSSQSNIETENLRLFNRLKDINDSKIVWPQQHEARPESNTYSKSPNPLFHDRKTSEFEIRSHLRHLIDIKVHT
jgi:hypothetical protein